MDCNVIECLICYLFNDWFVNVFDLFEMLNNFYF